MDTIRNYITRFAQWILRDELDAACKSYNRVLRENQQMRVTIDKLKEAFDERR